MQCLCAQARRGTLNTCSASVKVKLPVSTLIKLYRVSHGNLTIFNLNNKNFPLTPSICIAVPELYLIILFRHLDLRWTSVPSWEEHLCLLIKGLCGSQRRSGRFGKQKIIFHSAGKRTTHLHSRKVSQYQLRHSSFIPYCII
jgi:hypothetical protein